MARTDVFDRRSQRAVPVALIALAALLLMGRLLSSRFDDHDGPELVEWRTIGEAQSLAARTRKPILYDFTADWCGPCQVMKREVFSDRRLAARINEKFIPVRVVDRMREDGTNRREVQQLEDRHSVRAFPTIVFADSQGNEKGRMEGYRGAEDFERVMESIR